MLINVSQSLSFLTLWSWITSAVGQCRNDRSHRSAGSGKVVTKVPTKVAKPHVTHNENIFTVLLNLFDVSKNAHLQNLQHFSKTHQPWERKRIPPGSASASPLSPLGAQAHPPANRPARATIERSTLTNSMFCSSAIVVCTWLLWNDATTA